VENGGSLAGRRVALKGRIDENCPGYFGGESVQPESRLIKHVELANRPASCLIYRKTARLGPGLLCFEATIF
jgi:hypothetical protein